MNEMREKEQKQIDIKQQHRELLRLVTLLLAKERLSSVNMHVVRNLKELDISLEETFN